MDPEVQRELEEQFRRLSEMMAQQSEIQASLNKSLQDQLRLQPGAAAATKKNTDALNSNSTAVGGNTRLQEIEAENSLKAQKAVDSFKTGIEKAGNAVFSFTKTFISGEEGFKKYSNAMDSAGSAAWNIGKEFGIVGKVLGGLGAAAGKVAGTYLKQADDLLTATDSLAKLGAGATLTVEEVRQMGKGAGLASGELDKLIKPMQSIKGGFLGLGDSATTGIKKFGELTAVSENVRKEFQRLGMGDQERNQALADYITMMNKSGAVASGSLRTQQGLQKAALEYTRNLYELAQLTGEDVETVKMQKEAAASTLEVALANNKLESERRKAVEAGDQATIDRIDKEKAGLESFTNELIQAGATQDQIAAAQNQFLTGAITEQSAKFAMWGVNMDEYIQKHKEGSAVPGEFAQSYKEGAQGFLDSVGQGTVALSKDLQAAGGYTEEFVRNLTRRGDRDEVDAKAAAAAEKRANEEGKSVAAMDAAQINRNELTEAERQARLAVDELVASTNPLLNANLNLAEKFEKLKELIGFVIDNLKTIGIVIGSVIAGLLGFKIIKGVIGMFRGLSAAGKGLSSVFKGLKAAFNSAIGWLRNLLPGGKSKSSPGPKKGADGRYRDSKGRFAAAPDASAVSKGGKALKLAKGLFGGLGSLVGGLALDYGSEKAAEAGHTKTAAGLSIGSSAATGAGMGAMLGSVVPVLGTAVGAAIGGAIGGGVGLYQNWDGLTGGDSKDGPKKEKPKDESASKKSVDEATVTAEKLRAQLFPGGTQAERTTEKLRLEREAAAAGGASVLTPEETKELAEKSKEDAQTNNSSATLTEAAAIKNEATAVTTKKSTELFDKSTDRQAKQLTIQDKIILAFAKSVQEFALSVVSFDKVIKDLMTNLSTMTGSPGQVGANANSPATVDAVMAMNYQKESGGGKQLRVRGMSNAGTIGGGYGLSDAARKSAFESMSEEQKAKFTQETGFKQAPKLNDLVNKEGTAFLSDKARLADTMLSRQFTENTIQSLSKRLGRQPTMTDVRGSHWLGDTGYARFMEDLAKNPNMTMAEFYDKHKNFGGKRPDMKQFGGGKMTLQQFQEKLIEHAGGAGSGGSLKDLVEKGALKLGGGITGNMKNLDNIDPSMENALSSAITEYNQKTGKAITLTSGFRYPGDQARISSGKNPKAAPGRSRHERGLAVDINSSDVTAMNTLGILDRYGLIGGQASSSRGGYINDPPHIELKAAKGGIFDGPTSGYPIELHGQEIVAPLTADSVLMKLAKTPAVSAEGDRLGTSVMSLGGGSSAGNGNVEAIVKMHSELISVLTSKLDNMIDVLDDGNDTREKIFKHSMV
jgi:hypothetical protein